jgi:hypothetical protein
MNHFILQIWADVEPSVHGPFKSADERNRKALAMKLNTEEGQGSSFYSLDIKGSIPEAVEVAAYSNQFFE